MSEAVLVASLSVVGFLLLALFLALRQVDFGDGDIQFVLLGALQLILIGFLLGVIVLLGKVGVESYDHCGWLVSNSTTSGSVTSYDSEWVCEENLNSSATSFYKMTLWIMRIVIAIMILAFAFDTISYFGGEKKKKINGDD